jgi:soluble lytic murein transglycosylase-like protein
MKCLLIVMAVFMWSAQASAASEVRLAAMFDKVCRDLEIPKPVVLSIAKLESGLDPWVLNIEGRSLRFASKAEALARARTAWAAGQSFDVGLMQVNRWWLARYNISLEAALDPLANIYLGGWILKQEIKRHKDLRPAVGAYHSPDPRRARWYADQVLKTLEQVPATSKQRTVKAVSSSSTRPTVTPSNLETAAQPSMKVRKK